jgi:hypothetical protein
MHKYGAVLKNRQPLVFLFYAEFLKGIIPQMGMVKYRSSPGLDARLQVIILKIIKSRFPNRWEILPVFAVFLFFGFSWTLYRMFWYVPSWLEYLNIWKVITISAYVMAFGLAESIFMTGGLILFSLFFPDRIFKKHFILLGSSLAVLISIAAILLQRKINLVYRLELWQTITYPIAVLAGLVCSVLVLSWIYQRFPLFASSVKSAADRMTVFLYFYVPLGLAGWTVVLIRNVIIPWKSD